MSTKKPEKPGDEVILGKKFAGEKFSTVRSAANVLADHELQKSYDHPNAVPIEVYFVKHRVNDPVQRAMMLASTKIRKATIEAFDDIFHSFFDTVPKKTAEEGEQSSNTKEV
jgi:DnaJ-class molecular chaperone